jgi:hypothetical protein
MQMALILRLLNTNKLLVRHLNIYDAKRSSWQTFEIRSFGSPLCQFLILREITEKHFFPP